MIREIALFNIESGETLEFSSVKEATRKTRLSRYDILVLCNRTKILTRKHMLASRISEICSWTDECGRSYSMSLIDFIKTFGRTPQKAYNFLIAKIAKKSRHIFLEVSLYNMLTKESISCFSTKKFCELAGLNGHNDWIHIYPVLKGERLHHKGWCKFETAKQKLELKDKFGNEYSTTFEELIHKYGVKGFQVAKIIKGRIVCGGVHLKDAKVKYVPPNPIKVTKYKFRTPKGRIVSGNNVISVSRQLGESVSYRSLLEIKNGSISDSKKYSLEEVELENKKCLIEA